LRLANCVAGSGREEKDTVLTAITLRGKYEGIVMPKFNDVAASLMTDILGRYLFRPQIITEFPMGKLNFSFGQMWFTVYAIVFVYTSLLI